MTVSVVIPTFKRVEFLEKIITELCRQIAEGGFDHVEVLIVDNDPDRSAAVLELPLKNFRYEPEPETGVANARNTGVQLARGRFIIFLDDDELPADGWLDMFCQEAAREVPACFGSIEAAFVSDPPKELRALLVDMFSRHFPRPGPDRH